jgi:hypothetical protein
VSNDSPSGDDAPSLLSRRDLIIGGSSLAVGGVAGVGLKSVLGSDHGETTAAHQPPGSNATVRVHGGDYTNDARQNVFDVWQEIPGISQAGRTVSYRDLGSSSTEQFGTARNLLAGGNTDLLILDPEYLSYLVNNPTIDDDVSQIADLSAVRTENSLAELGCFTKLLKRCKVKPADGPEQLYAFPLNADAPMLVADRSLFTARALSELETLKGQTDPQKFWTAAAGLAQNSSGPPESRKILFQTGDYEGLTVCLVELISAFHGGFTTRADLTMTSGRNEQALTDVKRFFAEWLSLSEGSGDAAAALAAAQQHRAAFVRLWPSQTRNLNAQSGRSEAAGDAYLRIPIPRGVLGGQVLAMSASAAGRGAVQALAIYLSEQSSQLQLATVGGYVPTLSQMYKILSIQTALAGVSPTQLSQAVVRPSLPNYVGWSQELRTSVRNVLLGASSAVNNEALNQTLPKTLPDAI